jgi:hypothetical protein
MLYVFSINRIKLMARTLMTTDMKGWRKYALKIYALNESQQQPNK